MKEAAIETATKFKEAHDTILSKAKEKLPKEELEAEKDKIVNKVAEELSKKIETEYKDKLDNEVIAEIFKIIQKKERMNLETVQAKINQYLLLFRKWLMKLNFLEVSTIGTGRTIIRI